MADGRAAHLDSVRGKTSKNRIKAFLNAARADLVVQQMPIETSDGVCVFSATPPYRAEQDLGSMNFGISGVRIENLVLAGYRA
ncbi:hypothetical protein E4U15_008028, partial [Claviceps sp. LM218 group G6]